MANGSTGERVGFWRYYGKLVRYILGQMGKHLKATALAVLAVVFGGLALAYYQTNPSSQAATRAVSGVLWPLALLLLYLARYSIRAPWQLHNISLDAAAERQKEILGSIDSLRRDLLVERERNSKPEITLTIDSATFERGGTVSGDRK